MMNSTTRFVPLLIFYALVIIFAAESRFQNDESIYVDYATNLTQGFFSPPGEVHLIKGPGYPIVLVPFAFLEAWLAAKLLNALFHFAAVVYFYRTLRLYVADRVATPCAYVLGVFPLFLKTLPYLAPEAITLFLVCGFLHHFCRYHHTDAGRLQALLASGFLAYLCMVRVITGYVVVAMIALFLALWIWRRSRFLLSTLWMYSAALLLCLPYLGYTYGLTGKVFYWSTTGGSALYWMASPFESELGDWWADDYHVLRDKGIPELLDNHGEFFKQGLTLDAVEWDERLKARALSNIANSPTKYIKNWVANIGRLLFSYPYSYTLQKTSTYYYMAPNMAVLLLALICIWPSLVGRARIPREVLCLLPFALTFLFVSSLVQAEPRMGIPAYPLLGTWICVTLARTIQVKLLS